MDNNLVFEDSKVHFAWKLYIEKGILNEEVLKKSIVYNWERARLKNVDYKVKRLPELRKRKVMKHKYIDNNLSKFFKSNKVNAILINQDFIVLDSVIIDDIYKNLTTGYQFDFSLTGNLSLYGVLDDGFIHSVIGAEHYLICLHNYVDFCYSVEVNGMFYYLLCFVNFSEYSESLATEVKSHCHDWLNALSIVPYVELEGLKNVVLIEIDSIGSIMSHNREDGLFITIGDNLHGIFEQFSLENLENGGIVIFKHIKTEENYIFQMVDKEDDSYSLLISPLKKLYSVINQTSLFCKDKYIDSSNIEVGFKKDLARISKNNYQSLIIASQQKVLSQYFEQIVASQVDRNKIYNIDFSNFKVSGFATFLEGDNSKLPILTGFLDFFDCGILGLWHIETLSQSDQLLLLAVLNRLRIKLAEKNIKIVSFSLANPSQNSGLCNAFLENHKLNTIYAYDLVSEYRTLKTNNKDEVDNNTILTQELSMEQVEYIKIKETLKYCKGNVSATAKLLGFSRATLYRKMNKYNIKK